MLTLPRNPAPSMNAFTSSSARRIAALLLLVSVAGCGSTGRANDDPSPDDGSGSIRLEPREASAESGRINYRVDLRRPWTERFREDHVLIADYVEVHGPADLLDHMAVRTPGESFESDTWTTPAGLRQEITRKPNTRGSEAHAQLDNWKLYALQRLVVVQAPEDCPVRIEARGKAALLGVGEGGVEQRQERLSIVGEHGSGGEPPGPASGR